MTKNRIPLKDLNLIDRFLFDSVVEDSSVQQDILSIILIMPFDLFGLGKYCYTFRSRCEEAPDCVLNDGAVRIFLNTRGKNASEVPAELVEFLRYVEDSSERNALASCSERIKRIHRRVCSVKSNEETGVKYMQAWEERYYELEEAKEEGIEAGIEIGKAEGSKTAKMELIRKKLEKGKSVEEIADALEESPETIAALVAELS